MTVIANVQNLVYLLLGLASLGLTGFALVDVLRRKGTLFPQVGRLSKGAWLGILGFAFGIAIVSLATPATVGIFNLIGVVAAGVYLADVRPKLNSIGGGRGSQSGPYGPY